MGHIRQRLLARRSLRSRLPTPLDHAVVAVLLGFHLWNARGSARAAAARAQDDAARIAAGGRPWTPPGMEWRAGSAKYAAMILALIAVCLLPGRDAGAMLGLAFTPGAWGPLAWAGVAAVGAHAILFLLFLNHESQHVPHCPTCRKEWRETLDTNGSIRAHAIGVPGTVFSSVIGAVAEEVVWRGYLWWYATQLAGQWAALAATSLLFGLFHIGQGRRPAAFATVIGVIFGLLRIATGGLWIGMALHIAQNSLIGILCAAIRRGVRGSLVDEDCGEAEPPAA